MTPADPLDNRAWRAVLRLAALLALLLFVPVGTLRYWQAWVYLACCMGAVTATTVKLIRHDRALLTRRLAAGASAEKQPIQRRILRLAALGFAALLVLPGLEHRFGYARMPVAAVLAGNLLVLLGFMLVARVYRENSFTSATVDVEDSQAVVTTGPYAVVRHPMYLGASIWLLGTPLALASAWAFAPMVLMLALIVWRLLDEERLLAASLPGYSAYQQQVRWRLAPGVW